MALVTKFLVVVQNWLVWGDFLVMVLWFTFTKQTKTPSVRLSFDLGLGLDLSFIFTLLLDCRSK